MNMSLRN